MVQLPDDLRLALETELQGTPPKAIATAARALSERYRVEHARASAPLLHADADVAAYAAYRLPATFAAVRAVLDEVRARRPDLRPTALLDLGSGPGTAAWAALDVWPELERLTLVERDGRMVRMGRALAGRADSPVLRSARWLQSDLTAAGTVDPADITVAAYVIGELPPETLQETVQRLWDRTFDTCVIVEPGTPHGFDLIGRAGDLLAEGGAQIVAPFPHGWRCVESERDWCHFSQRVPRTRAHRSAKDATLSYEDEKYSYLAASRRPGLPIAARVIRHPQVRPGHIRLTLCTAEGVKHLVVTRKDREAYRHAKDLRWGSAIEPDEAPLFGLWGEGPPMRELRPAGE